MSAAQSGDKRVVTTDALETLGTLLVTRQHRDAIHLAVECVVCGPMPIEPGAHIVVDFKAQHLGEGSEGLGVAMPVAVGQGLGIADPFIRETIMPGQKFWFLMYPRQVHSLHHVWTHPAFPAILKTA